MTAAKFEIGKLEITKAAEGEARKLFGELGWQGRLAGMLARHVAGDWGDLNANGLKTNDAALEAGGRLFSAYEITPTSEFWIITEADRKRTSILLPTDY
jgi:hypothetical protein